MKFGKVLLYASLGIVFLFGIYPDPFLWLMDEIIAWCSLIVLIGMGITDIYKKKRIDIKTEWEQKWNETYGH